MRCRIFLCAAVLFHAAAASAFTLPPSQEKYAKNAVSAIIRCDYTAVLRLTDSIIAADPLDPLAPLIRLTALGARNIDFDTLLDTAEFFRTAVITQQRIDAWEKTSGPSSYSKMIGGFKNGLIASLYLRGESYVPAVKVGFASLDLLDESLRLDSTNADAWFFPGLYDYAKGELRKKLWWVMFWYPGHKEQGIQRLARSAGTGTLTAQASLLALVDIYIREKREHDAKKAVAQLENGSPDSRFVLWARAKYLESVKNHSDAAMTYTRIADSYDKERHGLKSALATRLLAAEFLLKAGKTDDAENVCRKLLKQSENHGNQLILKETKKLLRSLEKSRNK